MQINKTDMVRLLLFLIVFIYNDYFDGDYPKIKSKQNSMDITRKNIDIYYIDSDTIELEILPIKEFNYMINSNSVNIVDEVKNIVSIRKVYELVNGNYLVRYSNAYGIKVKHRDDYLKITKTKCHDIISLIFDKNTQSFYYSFRLYPNYVKNILQRSNKSLPEEYGSNFYYYIEGKEYVRRSKAVKFEDESILIYHNRTPNVAQGTWFPDFENFMFYFNNNYVD